MAGQRYIVTVDPGCTVEVVNRLPDPSLRREREFTMVFDPGTGKFDLVSAMPATAEAYLRANGWAKEPSLTDPYGEYWAPVRRP